MPKSCSFEFETCTCRRCTERRWHDEQRVKVEAALEEERVEALALAERQAQLRLPMAGLAHCADQPAALDAPAPLQLELAQ